MKTETTEKVQGIPFVSHVPQDERPVIENPKEFLDKMYSSPHSFGIDNVKRSGVYKLMGYSYDLKKYLKHYLYKQYGGWQEVYSPNKTAIRKTTYGKIDKIIEI